MSEKRPQTFANHGKVDPLFHLVLAPGLLLCLVLSIVFLFHRDAPLMLRIWLVLISVLVFLLSFKCRVYALKVQDRVIRLEEQLRLSALLPESMKLRIGDLTEAHLIALRFASDAELPHLVEMVLRDNPGPKTIKQSIQSWRPDYWRV